MTPTTDDVAGLVARLRFDAARCELHFSKGVASNIEEAATLLESQVKALREAEAERDALKEKIENACQASAETQPDWKHRCYRIMGALGFDYGDPDWVMPDEQKKIDTMEHRALAAEARLKEAEKVIEPFARQIDEGGYRISEFESELTDVHFRAARAFLNSR